jgi:ubiquitin thioesterase OTU1
VTSSKKCCSCAFHFFLNTTNSKTVQVAPFADAPEEVDQTIFNVDKSGSIGSTAALAANFVQEAHRARKYTDTGKFTLRCSVCQKGVVGEKEAVEHAKATQHTNFQEYC